MRLRDEDSPHVREPGYERTSETLVGLLPRRFVGGEADDGVDVDGDNPIAPVAGQSLGGALGSHVGGRLPALGAKAWYVRKPAIVTSCAAWASSGVIRRSSISRR